MVGHLRVPPCFLSPVPRSKDFAKFDLFTVKKLKQAWSILPLMICKIGVLTAIPILACHRLFFTTIDVQLGGYYRYEIPSVPRFFDLRNPRSLKIMNIREWKPAIHLDNRYRLMRHEPMLDADGNVTEEIGEDETAPPTLEDLLAMKTEECRIVRPPSIF